MAYLTDSFSTNLVEIHGLSKQNSAYSGALFQVKRASNGALTDIMADTDANVASALAAAISGSTGVCTIVYGQMGQFNLTATSGQEPRLFVDTDGKVSIENATGKKMTSTSTVPKVANPHTFFVGGPATTSASIGIEAQDFFSYGGSNISASRWGLFTDPQDSEAVGAPRNGANGIGAQYWQQSCSQSRAGSIHVWDTAHSTCDIRFDKVQLIGPIATATVTYPSTQTLVIGGTVTNGSPFKGRWRLFALYSATQSSVNRNAITDVLMASMGLSALPATVTDGDGFVWVPDYSATDWSWGPTNSDNIQYVKECSGYPWSNWECSNVSNNVNFHRYEVRSYDNDIVLNGSERSERDLQLMPGGSQLNRPDTLDEIFFFKISAPIQSGSWSDIAQIHTANNNIPDFAYIEVRNNQIKHVTQSSNGGSESTPWNFAQNTWYAVRRKLTVTANGSGDRFEVWDGPHGTTLTKRVDISGNTVFPTAAEEPNGGYVKEGIYRGDPGSNGSPFILWIANHKYAKSDTYSSFVTTQSALPQSSATPNNYTMAAALRAFALSTQPATLYKALPPIHFRHRRV